MSKDKIFSQYFCGLLLFITALNVIFFAIRIMTGADFTDPSLGAKDFTAAISEFYLSLYPNPYTNTFKLNYISNNDENVKVAIYDLTGKLLETRTVEYADINNQEMGNGYVPGIYIVVLKQADISKSVRVIKK